LAHVLIVDDEQAITAALATFLERVGGHTVARAHTGREGLDAFAERRPDVVLLDLWLPDMSGFDVLRTLAPEDPVVIMITGGGDVAKAVEAMQLGAENFLTKPVELPHLAVVVERATEKARLRRMSRYLAQQRGGPGGAGGSASTIVGSSPTMRELTHQVAMLAQNDRTTVLLVGESGTGKGRIAEYIHANSPRAGHPFVEVSCSAVRGERLEAELFGVERVGVSESGAFDARDGVPGLLEVADGGSIFLDEIGDLDPSLQARLLRVLEGKSFRRLGGTQEIMTRVRVIAATHRDLVNEVTAERFREDLYYKLSVMPVHLPPLRARTRDDLVDLTASLLDDLARELPEAPRRLSDQALERLLAYTWPGNIRELRNVLERAMLLSEGQERIGPELFPAEVRNAPGGTGATADRHVPRSLDDVEREHIARTLKAHEGNRTHAARELGISRATLIKKIKQYGL
jgi:DNA-binding NtrC family response regulator